MYYIISILEEAYTTQQHANRMTNAFRDRKVVLWNCGRAHRVTMFEYASRKWWYDFEFPTTFVLLYIYTNVYEVFISWFKIIYVCKIFKKIKK